MLWGNKSVVGILQLYALLQEGRIYLHLWKDQCGRGCGEFSEGCPQTHRHDGHRESGENSGGDETKLEIPRGYFWLKFITDNFTIYL